MKKAKFFTLTRILICVAVLLTLTSVLLIFSKCVSLSTKSTTGLKVTSVPTYHTGIQAVFGEKNVLSFSFMNFLTYVMAVACIVLLLLKLFKNYKSPAYNYTVLLLIFASAIFFFCQGAFLVLVKQESIIKSIVVVKTISVGAIVSGALMLTSGIITTIAMAKDSPYYYSKKRKK